MKRHAFLAAALVLRTLVLGGCNVSDVYTDPEEKYAVFTEEYMSWEQLRSVSPLMVLDETGALNVCIEFPVADVSQEETRGRIERQFRSAVSRWNDMLNQPPPPDQDGFTFPAWNPATVTVNYTCHGTPLYTISADRVNDRAYAEVDRRRIVLANNCFADDGRLFDVLAHEYGHLMGLADTYTEPEIGLNVYGQPDSMMQYAMGFTEDDMAGIWNLWRYLRFGGSACGPGYQVQAVNTWGTYCIGSADGGGGGGGGGGDGFCDFHCSDYGVTPGECFQDFNGAYWECDAAACLQRVYACGGGGGTTAECDIACSWYGATPGDCFQDGSGNSWECDAYGCLYNVATCGDGGGAGSDDWCDYLCSDWGLTPGECFQDETGNSWQCDGVGCLQYVDRCAGGCEYRCADYGAWPGECFQDDAGYSWECDGAGCLRNVVYCASGCEYPCDMLGIYPGECTWDANGAAWHCDAYNCLQNVTSCC